MKATTAVAMLVFSTLLALPALAGQAGGPHHGQGRGRGVRPERPGAERPERPATAGSPRPAAPEDPAADLSDGEGQGEKGWWRDGVRGGRRRIATPEDGKTPSGGVGTEGRRERIQEKAGERVDQRQDNQARRIEHGIEKGSLTPDEVAKLQAQQKAIADLEAGFKSDGKLTGDEFQTLRQQLNTASRCIWAEKHDTEGNQMPAYRFGQNVFARAEVTDKLSNPNLSQAEAKAITQDFHQMMELKRRLATQDLPPALRAQLQAEYNNLLNKYFETR
jgi:hypothetical protein